MNRIEFGDCRDTMRRWAADGVRAQMCVTSPPYFGLRDYGHPGQLGLEQTPEQYVAAMVEVFRCVRDVLADDGTLWLNIGDSYASGGRKTRDSDDKLEQRGMDTRPADPAGIKPKDLIGVPWMLAFALRADGWFLRQDIIWHKPNTMPESVRDRCTKAHEYVFLLSKSERYFYDHEASKEKAVTNDTRRPYGSNGANMLDARGLDAQGKGRQREVADGLTRNRRSVWTVATRPYKGAHFATFPPALIDPCVLAGSRPGDIVLDPFMGSGTTAAVALQHGRQYLGCELNPAYQPLLDARVESVFAEQFE